MTFRLEDGDGDYFGLHIAYVVHGDGIRTTLLLGTQPFFRALELDGLPSALGLEWEARFFRLDGQSGGCRTYQTSRDDEIWFDSEEFFGKKCDTTKTTGSVHLRVKAILYSEDPQKTPSKNKKELNGVLTIHRPGSFVTGVHLYHGHSVFSLGICLKHYLKVVAKKVGSMLGVGTAGSSGGVWRGDAIGACVIGSGAASGGEGIAIFHNDNPYPGLGSFFERRSESGFPSRVPLPALKANTTATMSFSPERNGHLGAAAEFEQVLLIEPPLGVSRVLEGEMWPDGRLALDHTYFQQPAKSRWGKVGKVRTFEKNVLSKSVIGPSNPWLCMHSDKVKSSIALFNQFEPEKACSFDLHVFDESGKLVLSKAPWVHLKPFGFTVKSISAELLMGGITDFQGTYMVSHSRFSDAPRLPARLHAQALYRFKDGTWNAVQSDASIWSSPLVPITAIEELSQAKIRRRQLWYAPVQESEDLETLISLANLSYSLDYDLSQTLSLTYCHGLKELDQVEITLPAFGACLLPVGTLFEKSFTSRIVSANERASIMIYPKTGKTYCASVMLRDRRSGNFYIEHVLPVPKFQHER